MSTLLNTEYLAAEVSEGVLVLKLKGRVDSQSAPVVEQAIEEARASLAYESVLVDAEELAYISSAGLRVVLRLRKNEPSLKVINVSSEVYEIFDMTGFVEMLPIEKAYRRMSVEGCEVIGRGANGCVYRLDSDTIIKVYMNPDSLEDIHNERELARKAFVMGIPTAIPYDVVRVGEGYGSVFELLNAKSFAKLIAEEPERLDEFVKLYVDLMKKIHSIELKPGEMTNQNEVALAALSKLSGFVPETLYEKLYKLHRELPDCGRMMHGDYHIKNVMMQGGEVLLIDMDTLRMGHPVYELEAMFLAYKGYGEFDHDNIANFLGIPYETAVAIWDKSLAAYLGTDDAARLTEVENKARVVAYTHQLSRIVRKNRLETERGRFEFDYYIRQLEELLQTVDSLDF